MNLYYVCDARPESRSDTHVVADSPERAEAIGRTYLMNDMCVEDLGDVMVFWITGAVMPGPERALGWHTEDMEEIL